MHWLLREYECKMLRFFNVLLRVFYFDFSLFWLQYHFCCSHGGIAAKGQTTEFSFIYLHTGIHILQKRSSGRVFLRFLQTERLLIS